MSRCALFHLAAMDFELPAELAAFLADPRWIMLAQVCGVGVLGEGGAGRGLPPLTSHCPLSWRPSWRTPAGSCWRTPAGWGAAVWGPGRGRRLGMGLPFP
jgi:hypothetical protein